jgi:ketosteroid isomerase-like protein
MPDTGIKDQAGEVVSKTKRRFGMERPLASEEGGRTGIVRGALRAFGEGDMDGFLDALKDDAPFECPGGERFPGSGDHEGPDEVKRTFVADVGRTYTEFGFEPEIFVESDDEDTVIAFGRFQGQGVDGKPLEARAVQVWEFAGNTVEAVRIYADSADFPEVVTEEDEQEADDEDDAEDDDS